jgi:hypothetical protein
MRYYGRTRIGTMRLDGGWRTNENLPLPVEANRTHFYERHKGVHFDEDDDCGCNSQRGGSMQGDAEWAVVSVGIDGVDVSDLDESEKGKQRQAHQHDYVGGRPRATGATHPFVKSSQTQSFL